VIENQKKPVKKNDRGESDSDEVQSNRRHRELDGPVPSYTNDCQASPYPQDDNGQDNERVHAQSSQEFEARQRHDGTSHAAARAGEMQYGFKSAGR